MVGVRGHPLVYKWGDLQASPVSPVHASVFSKSLLSQLQNKGAGWGLD